MFFTQGIDGIADIIGTHYVFESLPHNAFQKYRVHSRIENIDTVPSHLNIFKLRGIGCNELQKTLKGYEADYEYVVIDTAPPIKAALRSGLERDASWSANSANTF